MKLTLAEFPGDARFRIVALSADGASVVDVTAALKERTGEEVSHMRRFLDIGAGAFEAAKAALTDEKFRRPAADVA